MWPRAVVMTVASGSTEGRRGERIGKLGSVSPFHLCGPERGMEVYGVCEWDDTHPVEGECVVPLILSVRRHHQSSTIQINSHD